MTTDTLDLPLCRWRGIQKAPGRFACASTKLGVSNQGVEAERCRTCRFIDHEPTTPLPTPKRMPLLLDGKPTPCTYLGPETGERRECPTCAGKVEVKLRACKIHGQCSPVKPIPGVACCMVGCGTYTPANLDPRVVTQVDQKRLIGNHTFNASIAEWRGRTFLAYRLRWDHARIAMVELDHNWQPMGLNVELRFKGTEWDIAAQEDPRLFVHNDQLWVSYCGVRLDVGLTATVMFTPLGENFQPTGQIYPGRWQDWEKNWGPFSLEGQLYAVHTIQPHRIVHLVGNHAKMICEVQQEYKWDYGSLRGGAPPILHNGEFYHFFHGNANGGWDYTIGVYTFEAKYPFRIKRFSSHPILFPNYDDSPGDGVVNVVFPGGAIFRDGHWWICYGYYDHWIKIAAWSEEQIEATLRPVMG